MMRRLAIAAGFALSLLLPFTPNAAAEETALAYPYSGDLSTRSTLTGDWGGFRNDLAAKGITFDASLTQIEQGVVDGGRNGSWKYGGRGNLIGDLDTQKLGLWPGGFLKAELEGNWSDSVNAKTGALLPVNTNQLFPLPTGNNVALPNLTFAQFVSPHVGAVVGKFDTMLSGDFNEFARGKGDQQFFNLAFNINPTALMVVPASTLGAGAIVLPTKDPSAATVSFSVLSSTGKASTSGFDDLSSDNLSFVGEGRVRTDFFGLTGHQLVGGGYSNKQFTRLDQRIGFVIENRAVAKKDGSWVVFYNFDQFLCELDKSAGRGFGLFGRFGASDGNPNPLHYFGSVGVGGKGLLPDRPLDRFGIGYYYLAVESPTLQVPIFGNKSFLRDEWGVEAFYNIAITPWMLVTPDVQVIGPSQKQQADGQHVETATVLGIRARLIF
jgi:porin